MTLALVAGGVFAVALLVIAIALNHFMLPRPTRCGFDVARPRRRPTLRIFP